MPNAAATTVPTTSAMRNENDLSRPLPSNDRTSTIAVVRIDTVRMCGSANVLSPGAPPRNSLSVNPDSETPTIKMTTPEIIGENRNRIRSITPVRQISGSPVCTFTPVIYGVTSPSLIHAASHGYIAPL